MTSALLVIAIVANVVFLVLWRVAASELRHARAAIESDDATELVAYSETLWMRHYTTDDPGGHVWDAVGDGVTVSAPTFWEATRRHKAATEAMKVDA